LLDCVTRVGTLYSCPAIRLRCLYVSQYGRVQTRPHKLFPVRPSGRYLSDGFRTVYVRDSPSTTTSPSCASPRRTWTETSRTAYLAEARAARPRRLP